MDGGSLGLCHVKVRWDCDHVELTGNTQLRNWLHSVRNELPKRPRTETLQPYNRILPSHKKRNGVSIFVSVWENLEEPHAR